MTCERCHARDAAAADLKAKTEAMFARWNAETRAWRAMPPVTNLQLAEMDVRDDIGDDEWNRLKRDLDEIRSSRKKLRGPPTPEQRAQFAADDVWARWLRIQLYHSMYLVRSNRCPCPMCSKKVAS